MVYVNAIVIFSTLLITVESYNYAPPPFVHASIGQNRGGVYSRDSDIYMWRPLPTDECHVGARSLHFLWLFEVIIILCRTQIASVLSVATVFIGLWTLISRQRWGRGGSFNIRETKVQITWNRKYVQECYWMVHFSYLCIINTEDQGSWVCYTGFRSTTWLCN